MESFELPSGLAWVVAHDCDQHVYCVRQPSKENAAKYKVEKGEINKPPLDCYFNLGPENYYKNCDSEQQVKAQTVSINAWAVVYGIVGVGQTIKQKMRYK